MGLRLMLISAPETEAGVRAQFDFDGVGRIAIGRDPGCEWPLPDSTHGISSRHCEIVGDGQSYSLRDTSTNGVFVNNAPQRLESVHVLRDGDTFALGRYVVKAALTSNGASTASAPPPPTPQAAASAQGMRGGDPAAMVVDSGRPQPEAGASPFDGAMTIRRPAPKPGAAPRPVAAPAPAPPARSAPAAPAAPSVEPRGPGDEAEIARLGALVRAFAAGMAGLLAEQAQARRRIGSRRLARPAGLQSGASVFSLSPDKAVERLAGEPGAERLIADAFAAIGDHHRASIEAAFMAAQEMGGSLDPAALGAEAAEHPAHFVDLYAALWASIDPDWRAGFEESFRLHYGAAYDEAAGQPRSGEPRR